MATSFFTRLAVAFVALLIGYSSTPLAFAASKVQILLESVRALGKVQRLRERASALEEIGKAKKSQKKYRAADEAEKKADRRYERAQKNKKDGKIENYAKHIRNAQRLDREVAENNQAVEFENDGGIARYVDSLQKVGRVSLDIDKKLEEWLKDIFNSSENSVKEANLQREEKIYILHEEAGEGDGRALLLLGEMYQHGIGVERSLSIAWAMYSLAEEQGVAAAAIKLVSLADTMTSSEFATAKKVYERLKKIIVSARQ